MASIDEMLFDALRRSNPIGRVIEDFKRAQPALQAASTAPTGAAEALIGKLMVSPAFRTSATEEEARRRALEQDDLFVQALLGFEQAQGNPIQRAMAANEAGAAGREFEQGVYNMFLDPINLIPIPVGKGNKVLQATRQSEKARELMNGVDFAGLIADRAVPGGVDSTGNVAFKKLIAGVGENGTGGLGPTIREMQGVGPLPEEVQQATTLSQLIQGAEKAGGVDSRGNVAFSDLIRGVGENGKGGLGPTLRETQPFGPTPDEIAKIMYDTSIGGRKGDVGLSQMIKGLGSDGGRGLGPALPDELLPALPPELGPTPAEVARAQFNTRIGGTTGNVKKADLLQDVGDDGLGGLGPPSMPELGPSLEEAIRRRFDTSIGGEQVGGKLGSIAERDMLAGVGVGGRRGLGPVLPKAAPAPAAATALADDLAASVATPLGQRLELMRGMGDPKAWRTLVERATGSSWLPGTDGTLGDPAADALLTQLAKDFPTLAPEQVTQRVNALRQLSGLAPEAAKNPYGVAVAQLERAYGSEPARRGFEKSLAKLTGVLLDPRTGKWLDDAGQDVSEAVGRFLDTRALNPKANKRILDANFAQFILDLKGRAPNPTGSSMNFTVPGLNAAEIDRTGNLARYMEGAHPAVLNADGTPKVFYHGTQGAFDTFNLSGPHPSSSRFGRGIYFTDDAEKAADYAWQGRAAAGDENRGPNLIPSFVNIKNPLDIANPPQALVDWIASKNRKFTTDEWTDFVKSLGYDGVVANGVNGSGMNEVVAFSPNQVKSAIGNRGTFDPNSASSINFTIPGMNAAINLGTKALTNQATAAPLIGGLSGGAAGATTGGVTGALATPEDRWGGAVKGAAGGAVLGGMLGTGTSAYGLRHVNRKTATNLMKHSWALARKDVVATTEASQGRSILPTPSQFASLWKNQTVSTLRQFGQDGTWSRAAMDLLQGRDSTKLLPEITEQISDRMMLGEYERLSTPVQEILEQSGMKGYQPKLGMPMVESVAMHGLSRSKSVVGSALLSTFGPGNLLGGIAGALKGAALPEFSGAIRHGNGALSRGFRETAFWDERNNKLIPLAIDAFKRLGYDLSNVPIDQLTRARVTQMYGAKVGAMWEKTAQNMVHMSESRVRYLFGDYTPGQKGAIGIIEKITGPGVPFSSWAIRAYPVALDMAIQNPWVALGVYQFLQATSAGAGKDGRPRWTAGKVPVSTEFPLLGAGARTLLGGQKGTAYVDPVGSLSPVGGDLFQPGADQEGPQSLYQQISEIIGRAGLPGLSPILQGIAYMLGLDYKGPGNMSRTQGMENSLGLIPGNVDLPGWGDVALRAGRAKLSPAFAGTELGAKLGATGDKYPTVYDPVARRYGELVVKATGKSLDDPKNRAYLYDLAAGTGELYDQARREVLLGGMARNAFSTTSPIGVATQGEGARTAKRDREGLPNKYEALSAEYENPPNIGMPSLAGQNKKYKQANPGAATYDVGSKEEAQSMLMEDAMARFRTARGVQHRPDNPAQLARVMESQRQRAQAKRIPPKK